MDRKDANLILKFDRKLLSVVAGGRVTSAKRRIKAAFNGLRSTTEKIAVRREITLALALFDAAVKRREKPTASRAPAIRALQTLGMATKALPDPLPKVAQKRLRATDRRRSKAEARERRREAGAPG